MAKLTKEDLLRCPCDDCPFSYSDCVYCKTCKTFERWELRLMSNPEDLKDD